MIKVFRSLVLGGETGSREAGTLAFLIWAGLLIFAALKEAQAISMDGTFDLLKYTAFVIIPAFIGPKIYARYLKSEGKV